MTLTSLNIFKQSKLARRGAVALACLLAVYFLTPVLLNKAAEGLIREDRLVKSDVIVALAGDYRCNREKRAAELWRQGWADKVVVSGMSYAWGFHTGDRKSTRLNSSHVRISY